MSISGLSHWLQRVVLDDEFRNRVKSDLRATLREFDLTDEEKEFLLKPSGEKFAGLSASKSFLTISCVRPQIIRPIYLVEPGPKPPPSQTAIYGGPSGLAAYEHFSGRASKSTRVQGGATNTDASTGRPTRAEIETMVSQYIPETQLTERTMVPTFSKLDPADIYIVGLGMGSADQVTREVDRVLQESEQVLFVDPSIGMQEYLSKRCSNVTDLSTLYQEGKNRLQTYKEMATVVIEAAMSNPPVTLALYGHPTVFAYPPFIIRSVANQLGLKVKVLPGVSAMDCILAELMIDPANEGLQMFEASDLLMRRRRLSTDMQTLIWQVGSLETGLYSTMTNRPERFGRFLDYLLEYYPSYHEVTAVFCSSHPAVPSTIFTFFLKDLLAVAEELHGGYTLFLPPTHCAPVLDHSFAAKLESQAHLQEITRPKE